LVILIILSEEYKLWSSLCSFLNLLSLDLSSVQIFSWTPCFQTSSVYVPLSMSESQVSHPYKTTGTIRVLYIPNLCFQTADEETKSSELNGSKHYPNAIWS
jgi:hypothetical protein